MNVRWLFGNFSDPQYNLSRAEQKALTDLAHKKYLPSRVMTWWSLVVILLPVWPAYKIVLPTFLEWLGLTGSTPWFIVVVSIMILLFWFYSAWMYRVIYVRPVRMAMREKGYDVCVACGYDLRGTPASIDRCPECGVERTPVAGTDSTRSAQSAQRGDKSD